MLNNGLSVNPDWVTFSGFGKEDGYNAFMELFRNNSLPEMLFASTFPVAVGIMEAAKKVSLKIPEDLDIICFGDSELNDYLSPSITCVTHNTAKFAEEAFELLIKQIEKEECEEEHLEIETELLIKGTCIKKKRM
jgi:DNA-binding LacI/PurR family transcriptional regulator